MQNYIQLLGHAIGFISVALFFFSYQRTQKSEIMIIQTIATALSCVQYLLIGATSGFVLNIVCIILFNSFFYKILAYNFFALSYSGMLSESISLVSVIIGIIRYRNIKPISIVRTTAEEKIAA